MKSERPHLFLFQTIHNSSASEFWEDAKWQGAPRPSLHSDSSVRLRAQRNSLLYPFAYAFLTAHPANSTQVSPHIWSIMLRRHLNLPVFDSSIALVCTHCHSYMDAQGDHASHCKTGYSTTTRRSQSQGSFSVSSVKGPSLSLLPLTHRIPHGELPQRGKSRDWAGDPGRSFHTDPLVGRRLLNAPSAPQFDLPILHLHPSLISRRTPSCGPPLQRFQRKSLRGLVLPCRSEIQSAHPACAEQHWSTSSAQPTNLRTVSVSPCTLITRYSTLRLPSLLILRPLCATKPAHPRQSSFWPATFPSFHHSRSRALVIYLLREDQRIHAPQHTEPCSTPSSFPCDLSRTSSHNGLQTILF